MPKKVASVLIVDDDPDDQLLLGLAFQKLAPQLSITSLSDGDELLPYLKTSGEQPDLILLDLNMQRMDGLQALEHIRSEDSYQQLPIVVLTTSGLPEDHQEALKRGANGFLTKPASQTAILAMLEILLVEWSLL